MQRFVLDLLESGPDALLAGGRQLDQVLREQAADPQLLARGVAVGRVDRAGELEARGVDRCVAVGRHSGSLSALARACLSRWTGRRTTPAGRTPGSGCSRRGRRS